ncbi:MAG: hypothetical protein ACRDPM_19340 [Solirubrobacteraceae bacterium]
MTAVVISGATAVAVGDPVPAPLLSVPEAVDLAILDPGQGVQLLVQNRTHAPLTAAVGGTGEVTVAPHATAAVPLRDTPDGARLHLQILTAPQPQVVTVIVTVEPSDEGPIAVGQAIGAPAR